MPKVVFDEPDGSESGGEGVGGGGLPPLKGERRGKRRSQSRREIAQTYRESQKLSYDTLAYYEEMREALAGAAQKTLAEDKDLEAKVAELEAKLVLMAKLIHKREQMAAKQAQKSAMAKREEEMQLVQDECDRLRQEFERAKQECEELWMRNRELIDDNEELRTKLYYLQVQMNRKFENRADVGVGTEVEQTDACVETDVKYYADQQVNTELHTKEANTDTVGLLGTREIATNTRPKPRHKEDLQLAFIFPMFR